MAAVPLIGYHYVPLFNEVVDGAERRCSLISRDRRVLGLALAIFLPALLGAGAVLRWYEGWNMPPLHKTGFVDAAVVIEPRPHPDLVGSMTNVCAMTSLPIVAVVGPALMRAAKQAEVRRAVPCNVTFVALDTDHLNPRQYSSTLLDRTWPKDELFQSAYRAGEPGFWERLGLPDSATILLFQVTLTLLKLTVALALALSLPNNNIPTIASPTPRMPARPPNHPSCCSSTPTRSRTQGSAAPTPSS